MSDIRIKSATLDIADDGGIVEGYAATFDREPDSYGDVIAPGAFAEAVEAWKAKMDEGIYVPLLYGHNTSDPEYNIGRITEIREDERGLWVHGELDAENEKAQYVRKLAREGRLYQFSFAYAVIDEDEAELDDGTRANELRKLDLFEVSLVQIPANQHAVITGIKSDATNAVVDGDRVTIDGDSVKVGTVSVAVNLDSIKSGRRNSAKDADELRAIADHAREIITAIDGLLADTAQPDMDEDAAKQAQTVTAAQPQTVSPKQAEILAYIDQITQ